MKTVLFVPGFQEDIKSRDYRLTIDAIESKGYDVEFINISWGRTILSDWVRQLEDTYSRYDSTNTVLAGFSYGALTAFIVASNRTPVELWLFSLSPYFSDDIPKMKPAWLKYIGKRRTAYFSNLKFMDYAPKIKCKTLLFYGEIEAKNYPLIGRRSKTAHNAIQESQLVEVGGAAHDVTDQAYINAIMESI